MLQFPEGTKAKLISVNPRSERHGETLVPALDLRVQLETGNDVLALLDPKLPATFYEVRQEQLNGVPKVAEAADLRFPELDPDGKWTGESEGYKLLLDYGLGKKSNILFDDCRVHRIAWTVKAGGTVLFAFTASCVHDLTPAKVGTLGMNVQHDVFLQLDPPKVAP
jgi:hypothetical protein